MNSVKEHKIILFLLPLLLLILCLLPAGCGKPASDAAAGDKETKKESSDKISIGLSFDSFVIERWIRDRDVFTSTARELGAEVNVQNANGDVEEQISQIRYLIEKKVDVLVVVAADC